MHGTSLDRLIPPEIRNDSLYRAIVRVAAMPGVRHMLEIGSSGGQGSTEAFIEGALLNPDRPTLHCIEVSDVRYEALRQRHANRPFVRCYHASSVALDRFASPEDVAAFHESVPSTLNEYPVETVLGWLEQDVRYMREHDIVSNGIQLVRDANDVTHFDVVLIDGSEFTGRAELEEIYGARHIVLDDIGTFKNHHNFARLAADRDYELVESSTHLRNGYAVFERAVPKTGNQGSHAPTATPATPVRRG